MGKLKFTLLNIWFWASLIGTSILAENLQFLSSNMKGGLSYAPVFVLAFSAVICFFMFYFINHKENKLKVDFVLVPLLVLMGIIFIIGIWSQEGGVVDSIYGTEATIEFTDFDRIKATIAVVLFLLFIYGLLFSINATQPHSKANLVVVYVGIIFVYVTITYSLIAEWQSYASIFKGEGSIPAGLDSFFGNKNYYGGIIFVGILACIIANYHRPRLYLYLTMLVFLLALVSTGSVLPTLIAMFAVPVYFVEEITRFAIKKKVRLTIYVSFAMAIILALVFIFYFGSVNKWKVIAYIDKYVSTVINNKNFNGMSGRKPIWEKIISVCFDSPIHILFGRGFMIAQKATVAYTGVRTTHNGYLQIVYEYGLLGAMFHLLLIAYFVYSLIRLMLEKRFHFAFVYGFCALCYAIYNGAESSPIFTYGIKELFVTSIIFIPPMSRTKLLMHKERVNEAMALPQKSGELNPVRLGKGLAAIIVSFLMIVINALMCGFTYKNEVLTLVMILVLIGLMVAFLFVPYLVSLYYRNTDKPNFVLHCVFNSLAFLLILFGIGFPLIHRGYSSMALWLVPFLGFLYLITSTVIYALVKGGSFKEWVSVTLVGGLFEPLAGIFGSMIVSGSMYICFYFSGDMNWFVYLFTFLITLCSFYFFFHFLPLGSGRDVINEFNKISLYHNKCCTIKDEAYYG